MKIPFARRGVASVLGTVFFVLVFMMALGSMVYAYGLESQASQARQQADQLASRRAAENLAFSAGASGLAAIDTGPGTAAINHLVLKFPNGTVYSLAASAAVPTGGSVAVGGLVPAGVCTPGTATCLSKYDQIVSGNPPGSSVGLVTSLGNSFWYDPATAATQTSQVYFLPSAASTSSNTFSPVPGLSFTGAPGGDYIAKVEAGYYQSAGSSNLAYFAVSAPSDAVLLACVDVSASTNPYQTSCSPVAGTQLPQPTCYTQLATSVCSYALNVFVVFGPTGGTVQLEFKSNGGVAVFVAQGSYMIVSQIT